MRSTMQDVPAHDRLASCSTARRCTRDSEVVTATAGRRRAPRRTPSSAGGPPGWPTGCAASASPATSGSATFQWNNAEHLEAYLAVPSMGAVLHTLNIRLFPEQLVYIANHAEDQVVIVDDSLVAAAGQAAAARSRPSTHVLVAGPDAASADLDSLRAAGKEVHALRGPAGRAARGVRLARGGRARRRGDVLHQRHDRATRRASSTATARRGCTRMAVEHRQRRRPRLPRPGAADRADVPRQRLGPGLRRADERRLAVHARPLAAGRAAGAGSCRRAGRPCPARCRRSGTTCSTTSTSTRGRQARLAPADPVRRLRRAGRAAEGAAGAARHRRSGRPGA